MAEIVLTKRVKYAGDVHTELLKAGWDLDTATGFVNNIPDADVAPVAHGRWIPKYEIKEMYYSPDDVENYRVPDGFSCSRCGRVEYHREPYCNCGARMDGE